MVDHEGSRKEVSQRCSEECVVFLARWLDSPLDDMILSSVVLGVNHSFEKNFANL